MYLKFRGFSDDYIRLHSSILETGDRGDFSERLERLFSCFNGENGPYECFFLVRTSYKSVNPSVSDIIIVNQDGVPDFGAKAEFIQQDKEGTIFKIDIEDIDTYSAGNAAYKKMLVALSLRKIYEPSVPESFVHPAAVVKRNHEMHLISYNLKAPPYIKDSNNPNDNYQKLTSLLDRIQIQDRNYIQASLQYYRLSLLANNQESKLVNLWIAIESLFQEGEGNIIGNITNHIPVIMARNYVKDILRSVSVDLKELWRADPCEVLLRLAKKSKRHMVHPHDLLKIFLKEADSAEYKSFLCYISGNPLLLYRVDNLKSGLFHSSNGMRARLERHRQNVDWQLRRIYRVRNRIMHQGLVSSDTSHLYRHLHTYFINTVHEIIHTLENNSQWSLGHVFEDIRLDYEFFTDSLKNSDSISLDTIYYSSLKHMSEEIAWQ
jgi:hypothetical protein